MKKPNFDWAFDFISNPIDRDLNIRVNLKWRIDDCSKYLAYAQKRERNSFLILSISDYN